MKYKNGSEFLNKLYKDMHMSDIVMHTAEKSDTPSEKIDRYLDRLEDVHNIAKTSDHKMDLLKKFYYDKYVIKELPDSYVRLQQKIARERGYGDIDVTDKEKVEMLNQVQKEQEKSLDSWIDYLCSDDVVYPIWFKNYAFQGMIKLGKYDKENKSFKKRSSTTTEPFLDLNREVLAKIYDTLSKEIGKNELTEADTKVLESGESFNKLYVYYLINSGSKSKDEIIDGVWIKYDQGSDSTKLCDSLQGKNTGWCTAGYETAKFQLSNGDFYVYYTEDENGKYTNPRIAIRMDGHSTIREVRGVGPAQNLEGDMTDIADKKLDEFPDKEKYKKKINDMRQLTEIDKKTKNGEELTSDELVFLYEINDKIDGFGYQKDPRIEQIQEKRNIKKDLSFIYGLEEKNIATSMSDFENNDVVIYCGDFKYTPGLHLERLRIILEDAYFDKLKSAKGLESLQIIGGDARFDNLEKAEGLENLQYIGACAGFGNLKSAKGLESLQNIGSGAFFDNLEKAEGLENLQYIGGTAYFHKLKSAKGLNSLQSIGGDAYFDKLKSAKGLGSLRSVDGTAYFHKLKSANGLNSLRSVDGDACFDELKSAKGLGSLRSIGKDAQFENLEKAEGLENLQIIGGIAWFEKLRSAKGLGSLQRINEDARFKNLEKAEGLNSLQSIGGDAQFDNLEKAEGLNSLQSIGGDAVFLELKSAKDLNSLRSIGGDAQFDNLEKAEGLNNLQYIGGNARFYLLKTAEDLENLQNIDRDAWFNDLNKAEGLEKLQNIGGLAYFPYLKTAKNLKGLRSIGGDAHFESLEKAEGLNNLQSIGRDADFRNLKEAKDLYSLQHIGRHADFGCLRTVEGLEKCNVYEVTKMDVERRTDFKKYEGGQGVDNKIK